MTSPGAVSRDSDIILQPHALQNLGALSKDSWLHSGHFILNRGLQRANKWG